MQFTKTFMEPLQIILGSLGWTAEATLFKDDKPIKKKRIQKETYVSNTATLC